MSDKVKAILDLASKHAQRAVDNEGIAASRAQDTHAAHLAAVRHCARFDGLNYAISQIRQIADEWEDAANECAALPNNINNAVEQTYRENAARLNDLAFQLLSEVDES